MTDKLELELRLYKKACEHYEASLAYRDDTDSYEHHVKMARIWVAKANHIVDEDISC